MKYCLHLAVYYIVYLKKELYIGKYKNANELSKTDVIYIMDDIMHM